MVSIVVPVYNRADLLPACLESLHEQDYDDYEIIAVDDGSTDDSVNVAKQFGATVVELGGNQGAAVARNAGVEAAHGEYVAFIDSDCRAPRDWLSKMVRHMESDPNCVGVNGTYSGDLSGAFIGEFAFKINRFKESKSPEHIETCNTSTFMCRREDVLRVGGLPRFFTPGGKEMRGREDAAVANLLTADGGKILMAPDVVVGHSFRRTWWGFLRQQAYFSSRLGMHGVCHSGGFSDTSSFDRRGTMLQLLCLGIAIASVPAIFFAPAAAVVTLLGFAGFLWPQRALIMDFPGIVPKLKAVCALTAVSVTWALSGVYGILMGFRLSRR